MIHVIDVPAALYLRVFRCSALSRVVGAFFIPPSKNAGVGDMVMATVRKGKPELRKKGEPENPIVMLALQPPLFGSFLPSAPICDVRESLPSIFCSVVDQPAIYIGATLNS